MSDIHLDTIAILKSLADDTRLSVVRRLARDNCEVTSGELIGSCANALNLSQPAMSHHFQKLVSSGVILERKAGTQKCYTLNTELLDSAGINYKKI